MVYRFKICDELYCLFVDRQRQAERKLQEVEREAERKRKYQTTGPSAAPAAGAPEAKRPCLSGGTPTNEYTPAASPTLTEQSSQSGFRFDETSNDGSLVVDDATGQTVAGADPGAASSVGRFTPLIPGRQRPRPGRGSGRRGRPPGSGKRARVMATPGREVTLPVKSTADAQVGFLSPEANRSSDISSTNGNCLVIFAFVIYHMLYSLFLFKLIGDGETPTTPSQDASPSMAVKRRPGRPRLRPVGPAHQGGRQPKPPPPPPPSSSSSTTGSGEKRGGRRGAPPGPRVIKPLPVPIGSMKTKQPDNINRSNTTTTTTSSSSSSSPLTPALSTSTGISSSKPSGPGFYGPVSP